MARQHQEGFGLAEGPHYLEFLGRLHATLKPEWYFEIGAQTGASLRLSDARSISVDPAFVVQHELVGAKPELYLVQDTSDNFFVSDRLCSMGVEIDLAFLDGMNLMEFLLRDFINTERHCKPDSVIVMHDCMPWNSDIAERERITKDWTGDVWKIVPILRKYRPDLELEVVDCAPTGLVIVSGLDPDNVILSEAYDEIVEAYIDLNIEDYGISANFARQRARSCLFWSISKGMRPMNYAQADHVFWASGPMYEQAISGDMAGKSSLLPQAFVSEIIAPRENLRGDGMVFVGRNRVGFERLAVAFAAQSGRDLKVWGPGWRNTDYEMFLCGERVENNQLSDVYSNADVVLNDHTPQMRENGQVSNRIFDTLACGAVPITDNVSWLPEDLRDLVLVFEDQNSFDEALVAASSETDTRRKERLEFARPMRERHSFAARAQSILEVVNSLREPLTPELQHGDDT